ncbi:MAG: hypothetical protein NC079_04350 [Clostridium sp.]|nr:hypothetical protein [Acetatifactor muris]MCM1526716.1 hypothetical protein [Bacteroides sp.]MCM1562824.1 hypothetical protein [Clostridium sp.]
MWGNVPETFQKYMGTGLTMIWFLLAWLYLLLKEDRKPRRILLVYTPAIVLLCFFNPIFAAVFQRLVGSEIYFRLCWLLPVITVIAYCVIRIADRLRGRKAACFVGAAFLLILCSGKAVYDNSLYSRAENIYHVPDSVVHICDAIEVEGREVMALFPEELVLYVRQYSPVVCMPYGREVFMGVYNDLDIMMADEVIDLERLAPAARQAGCHYVILSEERTLKGDPTDCGWELFGVTDGYRIYRDSAVSLETVGPAM